MTANSEISWTTHTFNGWHGCVRVSPGCENCYAEAFSKRTGHDIWGPAKTTPRRFFGEKHWQEPLKWNRDAEQSGDRARVFSASMSDVFEDHPDVGPHRDRLFRLIEDTPWLDWQLLTKRPENVNTMIPPHWNDTPPNNWWMGTSVEDQKRANERIPFLLGTSARIKFLSCEPLLGPVNLTSVDFNKSLTMNVLEGCGISSGGSVGQSIPNAFCDPLSWIIVGGESGPGRREMDIDWLIGIVDQCKRAGVAAWVKQDSGMYPGKQGRIPDDVWAVKQFPKTDGE